MLKPATCEPLKPYLMALVVFVLATAMTASEPRAQPAGCTLVPDERNAAEKTLRCGDGLPIRAAPETRYQLTDQSAERPATSARLDSGALLIEFTPSERRRSFQILTPHAIAAVRGTRWAVEVTDERSSTLVL